MAAKLQATVVEPAGSSLGELLVSHLHLFPGRRLDPGRHDALLVVYEVSHGRFSGGLPVRVVKEPLD